MVLNRVYIQYYDNYDYVTWTVIHSQTMVEVVMQKGYFNISNIFTALGLSGIKTRRDFPL